MPNYRNLKYAPFGVNLTTASLDEDAVGSVRLDLAPGVGTYREADVADGAGKQAVGTGAGVRYVTAQYPTHEVPQGASTVTRYVPGTGGRPASAWWLNPELVFELLWGKATTTSAGFRLQDTVDVTGLPCLRSLYLPGGRVTHVGVSAAMQQLLLSEPSPAATFTADYASQVATTYGLQANIGQGYAMGAFGTQTLAAGEAGVLDLRGQPDLRRLHARYCGVKRVLLPDADVLDELVIGYNALGVYGGLAPWNRIPLSVRLLMLGSMATGSSNAVGQVIGAGGSAIPAPDLGAHALLRYAYLNGANLTGNLVLPTANGLLELVAGKNALTGCGRAVGSQFSPSLRVLRLGDSNAFNAPVLGQNGSSIPLISLAGATGLTIASVTGTGTTTLVTPEVDTLLELNFYANSVTSITRAAPGANDYPASLLYLRSGGGAVGSSYYSTRLRNISASNTSYGQTTTMAKRTLRLTGCNSLIEVDARSSNWSLLIPQASKASTQRLFFSPIGTWDGVNATTVPVTLANNNAFTAAGSLNLTGYDNLTHLTANYCQLTNAALTLPGGSGPGSWAQHVANPLLHLELGGNNFSTWPWAAGDYPNLEGLCLSGHTTAAYPKLGNLPRAHWAKLVYLSIERQAQSGALDLSMHPLLQVFYGHFNNYGALSGAAATLVPPLVREFYLSNQTPTAGLVNKLDFSTSTATSLFVIAAASGRLAACTLPPRNVTLTVDLSVNQLTDATLSIPSGFAMPAGAFNFLLNNNSLGAATSCGLLAAMAGGRILANNINLSTNGLTLAAINALVDAVFAQRQAFGTANRTLLLGKAGDSNASPTGGYAAPAGYVDGLSETALTAAAAGWSQKQKLWVLANGKTSAFPTGYRYTVLQFTP